MDTDKIATILWSLIIGIFLGSIGWAGATYAVLTIKDWIRNKKEGNFKLGKNIKKGPIPKLNSLDDDD